MPARYDERGDKFVFETSDGTEEYTAVVIENKKLYPVGSHGWIWEEAD